MKQKPRAGSQLNWKNHSKKAYMKSNCKSVKLSCLIWKLIQAINNVIRDHSDFWPVCQQAWKWRRTVSWKVLYIFCNNVCARATKRMSSVTVSLVRCLKLIYTCWSRRTINSTFHYIELIVVESLMKGRAVYLCTEPVCIDKILEGGEIWSKLHTTTIHQ